MSDDTQRAIGELAKQQNEQGNAIAVLETQMAALAKATEANTAALTAHTAALAEYNGARKIIHWAVTAALAIGGWFMGKSSAAP